jgi:hypothetical protein
MIITVDGREYAVDVQESNCQSLTHGHDAPHSDGTPGLPYHHHHSERCADTPRNATLRPLELLADRDADMRAYGALHPGGTELAESAKALVKKLRRRQHNQRAQQRRDDGVAQAYREALEARDELHAKIGRMS